MDQIPYELLQHIAGSLLPRSQCRLALTSQQNYDWLYSPLLQWHAKWALIPLPKHNIYSYTTSISVVLVPTSTEFRVLLLSMNNNDTFMAEDLTHKHSTEYGKYKYDVYKIRKLYLFDCFRHYAKFDILAGCCKYVNRVLLLEYVNSKNPIYTLKFTMILDICMLLNSEDRYNLMQSNIWEI